MTGLDLAAFLRLLRVDAGLWISLAAVVIILALMAWTSWGSRRLLRKCLVVSILVHVGLMVAGGQAGWAVRAFGPAQRDRDASRRIRAIRVNAPDARGSAESGPAGTGRGAGRPLAAWDRPGATSRPPEASPATVRPDRPAASPPIERQDVAMAPVQPEAAAPELDPPSPDAPPEPTNPPEPTALAATGVPQAAEPDASELPQVAAAPRATPAADATAALRGSERTSVRPGRAGPTPRPRPPVATAGDDAAASPGLPSSLPTDDAVPPVLTRNDEAGGGMEAAPAPADEPPGGGLDPAPRRAAVPAPPLAMPAAPENARRPERIGRSTLVRPGRTTDPPSGLALAGPVEALPLPDFARTPAPARALPDVPEVYRPRLDPNRSIRAQRSGASVASEAAVERALDWLARHQDADGRWDAGTGRDVGDNPSRGEDDYTVHCPAGDVCFGECLYWEADTATTGLALLAYLGAGYTHVGGKHAEAVRKGLGFLLAEQKPDGDLRGKSRAVGMYCHAMASLALCEAYALTGDAALREPVERAVEFLVQARSSNNMAWRYLPGAADGDTSILGWVILVLKSAREVGIPISGNVSDGALRWLKLVSRGKGAGLASYRPGEAVRPTMTAEAWVCRQFLGQGGPGAASDEAAAYLLEHPPGRDPYDIYYYYYGTLCMYQRGGDDWARWNRAVRDDLVRRQRTNGHASGSWDPDQTQYGHRGGRIYTTALATLTLEVYYRYLRLYDEPPRRPRAPESVDGGGVRRANAVAPKDRR